ncbi:MAG: hypothetical protein IJU86_01650, partial [Firmicutes bacterium]|nr:hypothetical protein [Bacillota bacterium]
KLNIKDLQRSIELLFDGINGKRVKLLKEVLVANVRINEVNSSWVGFISKYFHTIMKNILRGMVFAIV